jgi:hypothetical protein
MRVAIYGCGPSGLLAAHAVALEGCEPVIVSIKEKSQIGGAQYLHEPIPGVSPSAPDGYVNFVKEGTREGYAEKIYGDPMAPCSWDQWEEGKRPMWSMHDMYERLWAEYASLIRDREVRSHNAGIIAEDFDLTISSIPSHFLCYSPHHQFLKADVWLGHTAARHCPDDTIIYNGESTVAWYRTSRLFGHEASESMRPIPWHEPTAKTRRGFKPLSNNCNCHSEVHRVGRFGMWRKGVLVHDSFKQARELVVANLAAAS